MPGLLWFILAIVSFSSASKCSIRWGQPIVLLFQSFFFLIGAGFILYSVRTISKGYDKVYHEKYEKMMQKKLDQERQGQPIQKPKADKEGQFAMTI